MGQPGITFILDLVSTDTKNFPSFCACRELQCCIPKTSLCFSSNLYVTSTEKKFAMIGASVSLTAIKIS